MPPWIWGSRAWKVPEISLNLMFNTVCEPWEKPNSILLFTHITVPFISGCASLYNPLSGSVLFPCQTVMRRNGVRTSIWTTLLCWWLTLFALSSSTLWRGSSCPSRCRPSVPAGTPSTLREPCWQVSSCRSGNITALHTSIRTNWRRRTFREQISTSVNSPVFYEIEICKCNHYIQYITYISKTIRIMWKYGWA